MIVDKSIKKIDFFKELYEKAKTATSDISMKFEKYYKQYQGDYELDGSNVAASEIRNITYEIIESQINSAIPQPQVSPSVWSEGSNRNAKAIERLCAQLRDKLPFEEMNDLDERYTYIFGGSIWFIEWDENIATHKEKGGVKIHVISPEDFVPQPYIYNVQDMEYCFIRFKTTKDDILRKYDIEREETDELEHDVGSEAQEDDDTADVIICFYKNEQKKVCKYVFSGDIELLDIDNYYSRKRNVCKKCGQREGLCECDKALYKEEDAEYEMLEEDIKLHDGRVIPALSPELDEDNKLIIDSTETKAELNPDGTPAFEELGGLRIPKTHEVENVRMKKTELPYYMPTLMPIVIRKNTSQNKSLFGQSDCEYLRPQQQQINKIESRIVQKLLRAGITPVVPEDANISLNNSVFGQVIKMKPGESAAQYGVIDTTPNISQDLTAAERQYNIAKRIIGITDSFQGNSDTTAKSGIAKQVQVQQAAGRLESKRRMKNSAYANIDAIIFQQYLAYADEPRVVAYKDAYGRIHNDEFNRYSFIEYDESTGEYYYDDNYLFSVDLNNGVEQQRATMWELNLQNLSNGSFGTTNDPTTLLRYWQAQERAHYPFARENVNYFEDIVKNSQTPGSPAVPAVSDISTLK